jgi:Protein of unknown function (DUF1580)
MADVVSAAVLIATVVAELQKGEGLSLSAAGRLFPGHRGGVSVNPSTVFRWVTKGTRGSDGSVVKLEAARVGGRWLTSRGAIARFVAALTAAADPVSTAPVPTPRTLTARRRASEKAVATLKAKGA